MAGEKYTRYTTNTYPDPESSGGYGISITGWTDDAWNRRQREIDDYNARLQWHRDHPILSAMGKGLDAVGGFINDEIFLNKDNIRVRNAQRHPEVMDAIQEGGNIAGAIVSAPFLAYSAAELAPFAWQGVRALPRLLPRAVPRFGGAAAEGTTSGLTNLAAGGGRTMLMTTPGGATVPVTVGGSAMAGSMSIPSWVAPTALTLGTGWAAYETGRRFFPPFMATEDGATKGGTAVPVGPVETEADTEAPATPPEEPRDEEEPSGRGSGSETSGESGGGEAPSPSNGQPPKRPWWKWEGSGNPSGSRFPNMGRYFRNGLRLYGYGEVGGVASDILGNSIQSANDPNHQWDWKATRIVNTLPIGLYHTWRNLYSAPAAPGDSLNVQRDAAPSDTITRESAPAPVVPVDSAAQADWTRALQNFSIEE